MRLTAARTTVETLQSADTSVALANAAPVKLAAQVIKIGGWHSTLRTHKILLKYFTFEMSGLLYT